MTLTGETPGMRLTSRTVTAVAIFGIVLAGLVSCGVETSGGKLKKISELEDKRSFGTGELLGYVSDPDPVVRQRAVVAMGRIQDPEALEALNGALSDQDSTVRSAALFAIGQLRDRKFVSAVAEHLSFNGMEKLNAIEALGKVGGLVATNALGPLLIEEEAETRRFAALGLARMNDSTWAEELVDLLADTSAEVRSAAAYAIGKINIRQSENALYDRLQDPDPEVRMLAAEALGKIGGIGDSGLFAPLSDPDWRVRVNAVKALGGLESVGRVERMSRLLSDPVTNVRAAAAEALGQTGETDALQYLDLALQDTSGMVRWRACSSIMQIDKRRGFETFSRLLDDPLPFVRLHAAEALGSCGTEEATEVLIELAESGDGLERIGAMYGLYEALDEKSSDALKNLLFDENYVVSCLAALILGEMGVDDALPNLRDLYGIRSGTSEEDTDVRLCIVEAVKDLEGAIKDTLLGEALGDAGWRVRSAALRSLGRDNPDSMVGHRSADPRYAGTPPPETEATIMTSRGEVVIELFNRDAPRTVRNFVTLAEEGFYDDLTFHRVVPNFVIQGGCPRGDGWGLPGYTIRCEVNQHRYDTGTVGMAHAGKDTGGSQFFITHSPQFRLDGGYTAFGRIRAGQKVVDAIEEGDKIVWIKIR
jgi:HEAT repeat protein/cyclophilin family peptidyl-prolyl cis-trans isomerase